MKHIAQAVLIVVVGAVAAWLTQIIPYAIHYDRTRTYE